MDQFLEKEIEENIILFHTRCKQCKKDPSEMIALMAKKMSAMKNLSFSQAIIFVFDLKGFTSYQLSGWKPQSKIKRRDGK